jgi:MFS family permease
LLPIIGILAFAPNLPTLFKQFEGIRFAPVLVPMVITISALGIATFSPLMGVVADRWGRRRLLIAALTVYGLMGTFPFFLDNLYAIIACRAIVGVAEAGIMTTGNALMGDYFPGAERHKWLGLQSIVGPIVASAMILAGGALGSIDWHAPFLLYALGIPVLLLVLTVMWEPQPALQETGDSAKPHSHFPWPAMALIGAVTLFTSLLYYVQIVQLGVVFSALGLDSPARISVFITIASLGVLVGGWSYRKLGRKHIGWLLALIYTSYGIGFTGLGLGPEPRMGIAFALFCQFGNGLAVPALINWALNAFDFSHRGRGMGLWNSCFFVGQFLSPMLVGGVIAVVGGVLSAVAALGLVSLAAAVLAWLLSTRSRAQSPEPVAEPR